MKEELWVVIGYEGNLICIEEYEKAKSEYEREVATTQRELMGEELSEDDMGLKVVLAKVGQALEFKMDVDEDGSCYWQTVHINQNLD